MSLIKAKKEWYCVVFHYVLKIGVMRLDKYQSGLGLYVSDKLKHSKKWSSNVLNDISKNLENLDPKYSYRLTVHRINFYVSDNCDGIEDFNYYYVD